MKNEAEFKRVFKHSIRQAKGYSISLAAPMISGIPDLYCVLPTYMPVLLEAKWLGELKKENFSRKIPFTAMQLLWIQECHAINPYTAMGLIGFYYKDLLYAVLVAHDTPCYNNFSNAFLTDCAYSVYSKESKSFDVPSMFAGVPIPKLTRSETAHASQEELLQIAS